MKFHCRIREESGNMKYEIEKEEQTIETDSQKTQNIQYNLTAGNQNIGTVGGDGHTAYVGNSSKRVSSKSE